MACCCVGICKSMKLGICTGFEHVETKTEEVVFREEVDFLSSLAFVVHPASPSGAIFILAGGHVRASAGALAVHTALIPRVCLSVRYQTPFSSRLELGPSLFLSTGKHPVGGQLPRVFFSALPGQSSDRPNLPPHKKLSIFQFPFASIRRATSEACSGLGKRRIDRSTSKRSSKKLQRATITAFFLDRSLVVVHCDRS